jgi:hypothetical protein
VRRSLSLAILRKSALQLCGRLLACARRKRQPTKKQQLKHAMTVQSAHMITTDYVTLSQPLSDGLLLHDRTEHKLTLIHSLGELIPMHTYTTEVGNTLERPAKHKAVLAGSIELEITSDEAVLPTAVRRLLLSCLLRSVTKSGARVCICACRRTLTA